MESSQENKSPILLSAVFSVDEFPWNDYVPWKEALHSILNFVDECIVVHGGKEPADPSLSAKKYITELKDPRISIVEFPLPKADKFNWMQHGRSLAFGFLHCRGEWCLRGFMDEVFHDDFLEVRTLLERLPGNKTVVSVGRHYLLGIGAAFPYRQKPLFFRRNSGMSYGCINPEQGSQAAPLLFDDLVDTTRWFDGEKVINIERPALLELEDAKERLLAGEIPKGYRDLSNDHVYVLDKAFFNTDVNYYPDEFIVEQKWQSVQGYQNLPKPYVAKLDAKKEDVLANHIKKIKQMLDSNYYKIKAPESLIAFADKHADLQNTVRQLIEEEYGLQWCRINDKRRWEKKLLNTIKSLGR